VKYACISRYESEFPITLMCRLLEVSRSGWYAWRSRTPSQRAVANERLRLEIRVVHRASRCRYGSPRVFQELRNRGVPCSENRVARVMAADGIRAKKRRRFRVTTDSNHDAAVSDNTLNRRFEVGQATGADRVWVGDVTYVPTREGWLYLAVVLDVATRMVVGWSLQESLDRSLVLNALRSALNRRQPGAGLLHHSDRGVQYVSADYQALLKAHDIRSSMSRKGNCWDNAVAESFFATLEWELIEDADWSKRSEARTAIFEYIEAWYNRARLHSSLGYKTPEEFDRELNLKRAAA
jgi:putative transposase